jgi:XapX domain-containing protein
MENIVKAYLVSLGAGVLVGLVYSALNVKSPAPPTVALIGLLGMLAGEHAIPFLRHLAVQVIG